MGQKIGKAVKAVGNFVKKAVKTVTKAVSTVVKTVKKAVTTVVKAVKKVVVEPIKKHIINPIRTHIITPVKKFFGNITRPFIEAVKQTRLGRFFTENPWGQYIGKAIKSGYNTFIKPTFNPIGRAFSVFNRAKSFYEKTSNSIRSYYNQTSNRFLKHYSNATKKFDAWREKGRRLTTRCKKQLADWGSTGRNWVNKSKRNTMDWYRRHDVGGYLADEANALRSNVRWGMNVCNDKIRPFVESKISSSRISKKIRSWDERIGNRLGWRKWNALKSFGCSGTAVGCLGGMIGGPAIVYPSVFYGGWKGVWDCGKNGFRSSVFVPRAPGMKFIQSFAGRKWKKSLSWFSDRFGVSPTRRCRKCGLSGRWRGLFRQKCRANIVRVHNKKLYHPRSSVMYHPQRSVKFHDGQIHKGKRFHPRLERTCECPHCSATDTWVYESLGGEDYKRISGASVIVLRHTEKYKCRICGCERKSRSGNNAMFHCGGCCGGCSITVHDATHHKIHRCDGCTGNYCGKNNVCGPIVSTRQLGLALVPGHMDTYTCCGDSVGSDGCESKYICCDGDIDSSGCTVMYQCCDAFGNDCRTGCVYACCGNSMGSPGCTELFLSHDVW